MSPPRRKRARASARLSRNRRLWLYAVSIGVWLSGALWLMFHFFLAGKGKFGPTINPLEPWWLTVHGAFAVAAIWTFGLLWGVHVVKGWPGGRRRFSGASLFAFVGWLIASGYLLYYVGDDDLRAVISILHWVVGLAGPIAFCVHRFARENRVSAAKLAPGLTLGDGPVVQLSPRRRAGERGSD